MLTKDNFKSLLLMSGFEPDNTDNLYSKHFDLIGELGFDLEVDFQKQELIYPESSGFKINERQTCNLSANENFVVFECVNRLFDKGYHPKHIELEPKWKLGHGASGGRADIWVKDNNDNSLLIIECKTAGKEFEDAWKDTLEDGGQLLSYFQQEKSTQYVALYASDFVDDDIQFDYRLIAVRDNEEYLKSFGKQEVLSFKNADTVKKIFKAWVETYQKDFTTRGLFEDDIAPYTIGKNKYSVKDLKEVSSADIQKKYHEFATILRQHNVSGHENAFDKLVNLFLAKIVDEKNNEHELAFYWKGAAYDDVKSLIDRLQKNYKDGMKLFLKEDVTYIEKSQIDEAFRLFKNKPDATKNKILEYFDHLKYYTNNDFAFIDVHNEKLFYQNAEVLLKIVQMLQDIKLQTANENQNQFLGDLFEGFLDKGVKQSEGQYFTPMPIVKFLISSLPLEQIIKDSPDIPQVIDYACGAGHFLNEYAKQIFWLAKQSLDTDIGSLPLFDPQKLKAYYAGITGIEKEYRLSKVSKVSAFMYGQNEVNIIYADALKKNAELKDGTFSILVANPPYSVKGFLETLDEDSLQQYELYKSIDDKQKKTNNSIECFFVERAKQLLKPDGVAAIILPSSILSNGNIYIKMREIVLKYFDMVAIAEFGSGTFGKTGTNTVTLFLRRKGENPSLADHYRNRVDCWFEGDFEKDDLFQDSHLLQNYCDKIGVSLDDYKQVVLNSAEAIRAPLLLDKYDIFKEYRKAFETYAEYKNIQKKKISARYSEFIRKAETEKAFYEFLQATEKDKLYFYMLAESQENPVVLVKSPTENKAMKNFLGYEWSSAKGNEGIKYLGANVIDEEDAISVNKGINQIKTPLFNPLDLADETKINSLIRNNYELRITNYENQYTDFVTFARLSDMLDFSRVTFDKALKTTPEKKIEVSSKYELVELRVVADFIGGFAFKKEDFSDINRNGYCGVIKIGNILKEGILNCDNLQFVKYKEELKNYLIQKEDFIVAMTGATVGKVAICEKENLLLNQRVGIIRVKNKKIEKLFLKNILLNDSFYDYCQATAHGGAQGNISPIQIKTFPVPLPPLNIQQAIVTECEKIDDEYNASRKTIEENKRKIADIFKKEQFIHICDFLKLSDLCSLEYGKALKEHDRKEGIYPVLGSNGRVGFHNDFLVKSPCIIIGRKGSAGAITWENENCYPIDTTFYISLKSNDINLKYLYEALKTIDLTPDNKGTGVPGLNRNEAYQKKIPVPPLSVQQEIVAKIEGFEAQIAECQKTMNEAADKKKAVLEKYL